MGGVMVSGITPVRYLVGWSTVQGKHKDYKISMCCLFANHDVINSESKECVAQDHNNASGWSDMYIQRLLFE
jgi:hypothetical protein